MNAIHLTELQMQELAMANADVMTELSIHLGECPQCKQSVANYRALFEGIDQLPIPFFDSKFKTVLLDQYSRANRSFNEHYYLWAGYVGMAALVIIGLYLFKTQLFNLVSIPESLMIWAAMVSVLIFTIILVIDQFINYNRKMKTFNLN